MRSFGYKSPMSQSSISAADLVYTGSSTTIYILVRYTGGFSKFEYYPSTSTFSTGLTNTAVSAYFAAVMNGFTYFGGQLLSNSNAYITKIVGNGSIVQQQTFVLSTSSDTFAADIVSGYGLSIDATIVVVQSINTLSTAGTLSFVSEGSYTQSSTGIFKSDIVYRSGFNAALYVQQNYVGKLEFEYPWSISGINSVSSTLIASPVTGSYPSWISLNSDYENINVNAPSFSASNVYYFGVQSVIFGENINKYATITIYQWLVSNWASWSYSATNACTQCASGYSLSSDHASCTLQLSQSSQSSQTSQSSQSSTTQNNSQTTIDEKTLNNLSYFTGGIILTSAVLCIVGASVGLTSTQGVWALFNQYQLILMLPFLLSSVPQDFLVFTGSLEFVNFNFSFLSKPSLNLLSSIKKTFDYTQTDQVYYDNNLESGSFVVNQFGFLQTVVITMIVHLCWLGLLRFIRWSSSKISKLKQRILMFFHFKTYIRLIIESYVFNLMAAFTETWRIGDAVASNIPIASYVISWVFTFMFVTFVVFIAAYYFKKRENVDKSTYFAELFESLRHTHFAKLYFVVFTSRRLLIVVIVVLLNNLSINYKLLLYLILQFVAFAYTVIVRPFESKLDCVVEATNDLFYLVIWTLLIINQNDNDNIGITSIILISFVLINSFTIFLIQNSVAVINLIYRLKARKTIIKAEVTIKLNVEPKLVIVDFTDKNSRVRPSTSIDSSISVSFRRINANKIICKFVRDSIQSIESNDGSKFKEDMIKNVRLSECHDS